ncbi:alpha-2,3-sialyltransferase [Campylobacter mucosalis]|uniref:alpha-2,3-sialyltransferase n=1 Tax=Campylobacter mucosalis TaxID=202 RepID=UPI00155699B1|nr:alpha-2,3-sialyltransferase [Campylobacter mucosalis]
MNSTNALISGNGPSLKNIDYSLLPDSYDIFRCNQFYFEDRYFLGKRCDFAFLNSGVALEQYLTFKTLEEKDEYIIKNIVLSNLCLSKFEVEELKNIKKIFFPDVEDGYETYSKLKDFDTFVKFNETYKNNRITSGIYMCAYAIAKGYKNIYLTGIDFYSKEVDYYAFDTKKKNLTTIINNFKTDHYKFSYHKEYFDVEALIFLKNNYDVNFICISPNSLLDKHLRDKNIHTEPKKNEECKFTPSNKPKNYTNDIIMPSQEARKRYLIATNHLIAIGSDFKKFTKQQIRKLLVKLGLNLT